MPILKKLIKLGDSSRGIILPADWLEYQKRRGPVENVLVEIDGDKLTITVDREGKNGDRTR